MNFVLKLTLNIHFKCFRSLCLLYVVINSVFILFTKTDLKEMFILIKITCCLVTTLANLICKSTLFFFKNKLLAIKSTSVSQVK